LKAPSNDKPTNFTVYSFCAVDSAVCPFTLEIHFEINLEIYVNYFLSQENF